MLDFLGFLFFAIGFAVAFMGIAYGVTSLIDKIQNEERKRKELLRRIITALEGIEANTRNTPNQS